MDSKQNDLEAEPPEVESSSTSSVDNSDGPTEAVRRKLDVLDVQDIPEASAKKRTPLKEKFSDLNSKLITYVNEARKTELMLAESERDCKHLKEKLVDTKQEYRNKIETLRSELDKQIRASVLSEEQRKTTEARFQNCHKQLKLALSVCETQKDRLDCLEQTLQTERRRLSAALEELVSLREQVVRERTESNSVKQKLSTLTIDHATLKERLKINAAELSMHQSKLTEVQSTFQYTADDLREKLAEQKCRLEKQFNEHLAAKCRSHENELSLMKKNLEEKLKKNRQASAQTGDYDLLNSQLGEQQNRAQAAEARAAHLFQKLTEAEAAIVRITEDYAKRSEQERRRREKLNQRLLIQTRAHEEIRSELASYGKLMENLDAGGFCESPATASLAAGSPSPTRSPSVAPAHGSNSRAGRSDLLRKVLGARKRSLSGGSDTLQKIANKGEEPSFER